MLSKGGGKTLFDVAKLQWIGSPLQQPHVLWVWHTAPAKTFEDLKANKVILGSTAVGGDNYTLPLILNRLMGAKLEIVSGYKGSSEAYLAMERGEVEGRISTGFDKAILTPWIEQAKVSLLLSISLNKHPYFPDLPLVTSLVKNDADRAIVGDAEPHHAIADRLLGALAQPRERFVDRARNRRLLGCHVATS
jgi:tripartite-type tricarboxylate transporter receptor subunit TctC